MRHGLTRRLVLGVAVLVGAVIAGLIVGRVTVLRTVLDAQLAARGLADARYTIAAVGLTATRLVDIELGRELAMAEVSLRYRPLSLLGLEIEEVAVRGLRLDLTSPVDAAPGPLRRQIGAGSAGATAPRIAVLPRLRVADGTLQLSDDITVSLYEGRLDPASTNGAQALAIEALHLTAGHQRIALRGIAAELAAQDESAARRIRFTVAELRHEAENGFLAPFAVAGSGVKDGGRWQATARASSTQGAVLDLSARYDSKAGSAEARLTLPTTRFVPGGLQPAAFVPTLQTVADVGGVAGGRVDVRWREGQWRATGELALDDVRFTVTGVAVDSLTARLRLSGEGEPWQPVLRLDRARLAVGGGEVTAQDILFRPTAETNRLRLHLRDLDLARLLSALDIEGVSGEGRIAGPLPIVLADGAVAIEQGRLEALGPGVLRIASPEAAATLAQGGEDADLLLRALADFRYDRLSLTIDKPLTGESRLTLATTGHNPAVLDGHPFQITITLTTNLDKILALIGEGGRLSQEIIRAIVGPKR